MFLQKKQFLGLDIGSSGTKAVLLELAGKSLSLLCCQESANETEGILNGQERIQETGFWLKENSWQALPACLGIPQYSGSVMLADFPGGSKQKIAKMVAFETRQLAGVSDESFAHAWRIFPPAFDRQCPVLIAICNEAAVTEHLNSFREKAQGNPVAATLNGLALLNAFINLEQDAARSDKPVLLLDLGQTASTVVVAAAGQPLYIGTLDFAAERFNKALENRQYQHLEGLGLRRLREINLVDESERSPMLLIASRLEEEIHQTVEHWRSLEKPALSQTPVKCVYLSGGASRIGTLREWLQQRLEVPVQLFGPQWDGEIRPEFATAYGLGLQAAGKAAVDLELLPAPLAYEKQRRRRFPLLIAALALFLFTFTGWQALLYKKLGRETTLMKQQTSQLAISGSLTEELERLQKQLLSHEQQLIPLLTAGKQTARFREAIQAMAEACDKEDWFIYLGDEESFRPPEKKIPTKNQPSSAGKNFFSASVSSNATVSPDEEFPLRLFSAERGLIRNFICAGFTPFVPAQPYEQVRKIAGHLQKQAGFPGVDLLPERIRVQRDDLFLPWQQLFRRLPDARYRPFVFKMPLEQNSSAGGGDSGLAE